MPYSKLFSDYDIDIFDPSYPHEEYGNKYMRVMSYGDMADDTIFLIRRRLVIPELDFKIERHYYAICPGNCDTLNFFPIVGAYLYQDKRDT